MENTKEVKSKKRVISFGKIPTIKSTLRDITRGTRYIGISDDGEGIYNEDIPLPIYSVDLTEKIHGSNAGWCFNNEIGFWVQSRKSIISTKTKDNAGCAVDAESKEFELTQMTKKLAEFWGVDLNKHIITVYYEWAGGNIRLF